MLSAFTTPLSSLTDQKMAIFDPADYTDTGPSSSQSMQLAGPRRTLFYVSTGSGEVLWLDPDSGEPARTARREFPIFASPLPSFVYEIYECVDRGVFARGLSEPSGLAIAPYVERKALATSSSIYLSIYLSIMVISAPIDCAAFFLDC